MSRAEKKSKQKNYYSLRIETIFHKINITITSWLVMEGNPQQDFILIPLGCFYKIALPHSMRPRYGYGCDPYGYGELRCYVEVKKKITHYTPAVSSFGHEQGLFKVDHQHQYPSEEEIASLRLSPLELDVSIFFFHPLRADLLSMCV